MVKKKKASKRTSGKAKTKAKTSVKKKAAKKSTRKKKVTPIPEEYKTITASLKQINAQATIDFCQRVFGAKTLSLLPAPDGRIMHAQLKIGTSLVHIADAVMGPALPSCLFVYVKDVDQTVAKAVEAGASVIVPAENAFWGDRFAVVADTLGNTWEIASRYEIVGKAELKKRVKAMSEQEAGSHSAEPSPEG